MGIFLVLPQSFTQGRSQHTKRKSIFSTLAVPIGTQAIYFTCNLYFAKFSPAKILRVIFQANTMSSTPTIEETKQND